MPLDYVGTIHVDSHVIDKKNKNSLSSFTTTLASPLDYGNEEFEVALVNMTYTNSVYNVPSGQFFAMTDNIYNFIKVVSPIPEGKYDTPEALMQMINDSIDKSSFRQHVNNMNTGSIPKSKPSAVTEIVGANCFGVECVVTDLLKDALKELSPDAQIGFNVSRPRLNYTKASGMVAISEGELSFTAGDREVEGESRYLTVIFSKDLAEMLGFPVYIRNFDHTFLMRYTCWAPPPDSSGVIKVVDDKRIPIAYSPYDKTAGLGCLFVYTDIIRHHPVGNTQAQLLKVISVPNDSNFGDIISQDINSLQYYPLLHKSFNSIEIRICDGSGKEVPFKYGRVIIVLDIRKKNAGYL